MEPHHHEEKHFNESLLVRDVVIGMSDGLTVPFALAAGLSSAVQSNSIIVTAGIAEVIAGSIAMGLGGYLAERTQIEHYHGERKREHLEVQLIPEKEKQEIRDILKVYGISGTTQNKLIEELMQNKDHWVDFMMKFELGLEQPKSNRASRSAVTIGASYMLGGVIPLIPYLWTAAPNSGLYYSCIATIVCLFIFGYIKSRLVNQPALIGALKVTSIGALAAAAAYFATKLVQ